jgi:hypothetical protein
MNSGKEWLVQPDTHAVTMATRDLAASLPNGYVALPQGSHPLLFFFQKNGGQQSQRPKAQQGLGAPELILVQTTFFLSLSKEDFHVPSSRDVGEQHLGLASRSLEAPYRP